MDDLTKYTNSHRTEWQMVVPKIKMLIVCILNRNYTSELE